MKFDFNSIFGIVVDAVMALTWGVISLSALCAVFVIWGMPDSSFADIVAAVIFKSLFSCIAASLSVGSGMIAAMSVIDIRREIDQAGD